MRTRLLICAVVAVLLVGLGAYFFVHGNSSQEPTTSAFEQHMPVPPVTTPEATSIPKIPVVIYETETNSGPPEFKFKSAVISIKIGDHAPETLATFSERPSGYASYTLSPDRNSLIINFGKKISILDLTTKQVRTPPVALHWEIEGLSFSPDGTQLLLSDFSWYPPCEPNAASSKGECLPQPNYLHRITLATNKDEVTTIPDYPVYFPGPWRSDGKVTLQSTSGKEGSIPELAYFDLTTNTIHQTPGDGAPFYFSDGTSRKTTPVGAVSMDGEIAAETEFDGAITDSCSGDMGYAGSSHFKLIDPISGQVRGEVMSSTSYVNILGFSPNDTQVLYEAETPASASDCSKPLVKSYRVADISTGKTAPIQTPKTIFSSWNLPDVGASLSDATTSESIVIDGKALVTAPAPPWPAFHIAAQYYR